MSKLDLKNGIPTENYYELLDWKDKNLQEYNNSEFGGRALNDLGVIELIKLYNYIINK